MKIEFTSDHLKLKGILHLPDKKHPPLVVGSHGLEGSKESAKQQVLSHLLVDHQMAFFRFDHRGCGQSQGNFLEDTSLEKRTIDLIAAVTHVLSLGLTSRDVAVFGSSMGGATCINAWEKLQQMDLNLCGAVLCAAPIKSRTIENIPLAGNDSRPALPLSFFKENLLFDLTGKAEHLSDLLIFHGDQDAIVPVSNAHELYRAAGQPKELIIQEDGDHQMTIPAHQKEFEKETISWFSRCFHREILRS